MQDANIQTDTPSLSDDDNTTGTDDGSNYNPPEYAPRMPAPPSDHHPEPSPAHQPQFVPNPCPKLEISFGTQTTDEYSSETLTDLVVPAPVLAQAQHFEPVEVIQTEPVRLEPEPEPVAQDLRPAHCYEPAPPPVVARCPDISGLELLSNSIEAFEKHIFIKKEPGMDKPKEVYAMPELTSNQHHPQPQPQLDIVTIPVAVAAAPVSAHGGLDILCALAEQRFQEEVGSLRGSRKRSSSSEASESKKPRKHHKEKHSGKKSAKRSKHRKERRKERSSRSHHPSDDDETVKQDLTESFNRVKASLGCASCSKTEPGTDGCCRDRCNWPSAEEVYIAMNSDMRNRLAQMAKEVQEEKRKLHEVKSSLLPASELVAAAGSPLRSVSSVSDSNPFDQSTNAEAFPSYRLDDAETTNSSGSSKRKSDSGDKPDADAIANKKVKSLVEYILSSKNRASPLTPDRPSTMDETSHQSSSAASIKHEVGEHDELLTSVDLFGGAEKQRKSSKHSLKHKKTKSKDRKHRRSSDIRERKRRIDARCTLTSDQLDSLTDKANLRVLTAMGGLFYAGCLSAVQPPDVYAVTLDGERGNRPHFMSREEVLRDAVC